MDLLSSDFTTLPDPKSTQPDQNAEKEEVWSQINKLPRRLRDPLLARFSLHPDAADVRELADQTGLSRQSIYSRSNQAIKHVRRELRIVGN